MNYILKYADFLRGFLDVKASVRVVLDASNGPTGLVLEELFKNTENVEVIILNKNLSGDFPAHGPNPLAEGALDEVAKKIIEESADIGAVYDGDGDRVIFLDNKGERIDPFDSFSLIKDRFNSPYIVEVRALSGFVFGGSEVIEVAAGRSYINKALKEHDAELGVERSGHFFFKDFFYQDSAILATIHMINAISVLKKKGKKVDKVLTDIKSLERPPEINFEITDGEGVLRRIEENYGNSPEIKIRKLDGISVFGPDFAFNVRTSNTEPLVRLNIAAKNKKIFEEKFKEVKRVMEVD